jgi:hypothetical protein
MGTGSGGRRGLAAVISAVAIIAAVAGCTPGTSSSSSATKVDTLPSSAPSTSPTTAATTTTPATSAATTTAATSASATATATGVGKCVASQLTVTLGPGTGGGAGHQYPVLVFTNKGATACTLTGYPGVSFVGNGNGTQLGAAATREAAGISVTTLSVAPGASAHAQLNITNAGNYDAATCNPKTADGLRVYPPNETHSLFVAATSYTACQKTSVVVIQVRPLQAGAA